MVYNDFVCFSEAAAESPIESTAKTDTTNTATTAQSNSTDTVTTTETASTTKTGSNPDTTNTAPTSNYTTAQSNSTDTVTTPAVTNNTTHSADTTVTTNVSNSPKHSPDTTITTTIRITNRVFSIFLTDFNSPAFKALEAEITTMFNQIYNCTDCATKSTYQGVLILQFRAGSVIADNKLSFSNQQSASDAIAMITKALSTNNNNINSLQVADVKISETPISASASDLVPGWGIALLVLMSIILLFAVIFIIVMASIVYRRRSQGNMDVFATRGSYHSMNDYSTYQSHGRYIAPSKQGIPGNGTKSQYSYSNQGLETNDL
ncbi:mucin-1 [Pelodytes ibericus]